MVKRYACSCQELSMLISFGSFNLSRNRCPWSLLNVRGTCLLR
uniref:Uncharacterized protein n=1 Tax=Anguilla anguilla TaxID=7936 RepID=A0A0E9WM38_ANGAN